MGQMIVVHQFSHRSTTITPSARKENVRVASLLSNLEQDHAVPTTIIYAALATLHRKSREEAKHKNRLLIFLSLFLVFTFVSVQGQRLPLSLLASPFVLVDER